MSHKGIAHIEPIRRADLRFWAKLVDQNGHEREMSSHWKFELINYLFDSGYQIHLIPTAGDSEPDVEKILADLIEKIPASYTLDDDRIPEGYDDYESVSPFVRGANSVIGLLRDTLDKHGLPHYDARYGREKK